MRTCGRRHRAVVSAFGDRPARILLGSVELSSPPMCLRCQLPQPSSAFCLSAFFPSEEKQMKILLKMTLVSGGSPSLEGVSSFMCPRPWNPTLSWMPVVVHHCFSSLLGWDCLLEHPLGRQFLRTWLSNPAELPLPAPMRGQRWHPASQTPVSARTDVSPQWDPWSFLPPWAGWPMQAPRWQFQPAWPKPWLSYAPTTSSASPCSDVCGLVLSSAAKHGASLPCLFSTVVCSGPSPREMLVPGGEARAYAQASEPRRLCGTPTQGVC